MQAYDVSLKQFLRQALDGSSGLKAFSTFRNGVFTLTYRDVIDLSLRVSEELAKFSLRPEDKVAILLDSCPEYPSSFFGSGLRGHTTLLLDSKLSAEEMKQIFLHSDSKVIISGFTARPATEKLLSLLSDKPPVLYIDEVGLTKSSVDELRSELSQQKGIEQEDTALLVYTSGTTSAPKGVMLTLGNILFNAYMTVQSVEPVRKKFTLLSILPLNHMFEFNCGMLAQIMLGSHVVYANTLLPHEIMERLQTFSYTDMIAVPLFLRSIRAALLREVKKSVAKRAYFAVAFGLSRIVQSQSFRRKLFAPVIKKFGGIRHFMTGGAAIERSTQEFFVLMGFTVTQGYGLTETSPVATVNFKGNKLLGTQGKALPGTEVKVDADTGEILIRGPHVMKGYYKNPELTAQVITRDGWFKSGDIGNLDKDGNLFITGRLKELIVLGNGKKVFPDEVESIMPASTNIKEIIIVGAQEKSGPLKDTETVCAVVVPADEIVKKVSETDLRDLLEREVRKSVEKIAAYKRPSRIYLSYQELPKTNTRKNKRMLIKRMIEEGAFA